MQIRDSRELLDWPNIRMSNTTSVQNLPWQGVHARNEGEVLMKKIIFPIVVCLLFSLDAWGAKKTTHTCILPDYLCISQPDKEWSVDTFGGGDQIVKVQSTHSSKNQFFQPRFIISRLTLKPYQQKRWQREVENHMKKKYGKSYAIPSADGRAHHISYTFSDHFLPVEGMAIAHMGGDAVYVLECQRQLKEGGRPTPMVRWCTDFNDDVLWPNNMKWEPDNTDYLVRWSEMPFDPKGLKEEYERIENQAHAELPLLQERVLKDYLGYLITNDLYSPNPPSREASLQDLSILKRYLSRTHDEVLMLIMDIHQEYLSGKPDHVEKNIGRLIKIKPTSPYWMMSLWMEKKDPAAALSFADRAVIAYPTLISRYTQARLYNKHGRPISMKEMSKNGGAKNASVLALLAYEAIDRGDKKQAHKYIKKGERIDPQDIDIQFAKARLYAMSSDENDGGYEKANTVYADISKTPGLSDDNRIKLYYEWAEHVFDPDQKIDFYNRIIAIKKDSPQAYYHLGRVYMLEKRDTKNALSNFKSYVRYAPRDDAKVAELKRLIWKMEGQYYARDRVSSPTTATASQIRN
jgi:tetratricopeptide (TPR) repeat protein